jgi:hypothetical protein
MRTAPTRAASPTTEVQASGRSGRSAIVFIVGALVLTITLGTRLKGNGEPLPARPSDATASLGPPGDGPPTTSTSTRVLSGDGPPPPLTSTRSTGDPVKQDMAIVDLDGVVIRKVRVLPDGAYAPSLSPDGSSIAFLTGNGDVQRLMTISTDGSGLREIGPPRINAGAPAWSPDGAMIAFSGEPADGPGPSFEIYVANADGSDLRELTSTDPGFATDPQWSPDGSTIAYSRKSSPGGGNFEGDLWIVSPRGESQLTSTSVHGEKPVFSPDGSQVAFSRRGRIWVMGSDGSDPHVLVRGDRTASAPRWSPDGTLLAYIEGETGDTASQSEGPFVDQGGHIRPALPQKVYVIDVATGQGHAVGTVVTAYGNAPIWWTNDRLLLRRVRVPPSLPRLDPSDALSVGRHYVTVDGVPVSFKVPTKGWRGFGDLNISKKEGGPARGAEAIIYWTTIFQGAHATPCGQWWGAPDGSVADYAAAAAKGSGDALAVGPKHTDVGGLPAERVAFTVRPDSIRCDPGFYYTWNTVSAGAWPNTHVGDTVRVWILDVNGARLYIEGDTREDAGSTLEREIDRIVGSIRFDERGVRVAAE